MHAPRVFDVLWISKSTVWSSYSFMFHVGTLYLACGNNHLICNRWRRWYGGIDNRWVQRFETRNRVYLCLSPSGSLCSHRAKWDGSVYIARTRRHGNLMHRIIVYEGDTCTPGRKTYKMTHSPPRRTDKWRHAHTMYARALAIWSPRWWWSLFLFVFFSMRANWNLRLFL